MIYLSSNFHQNSGYNLSLKVLLKNEISHYVCLSVSSASKRLMAPFDKVKDYTEVYEHSGSLEGISEI